MSFTIFIIVFAAIVQVLDIILDIKKESYTITNKIILISIKVLAVFGLGYLAYSDNEEKKMKEEIAAIHGEFGKQNDALLESPYYRIGNLYLNMEGFAKSPIGFSSQFTFPIDVTSKNNLLFISAYVRDSKGDMVASIHGREWDISNGIGIDYNNDDSAFEVVTPDYRVIAQFILKRDTLVYNGLLCSESGNCIYCSNSSMNFIDSNRFIQRFYFPENYNQKTLFKYPRYRFLHIRDTLLNETK